MRKIRIFFDGHLFDVIFQGTRTLLKGLLVELLKTDTFDVFIGANDKSNLDREFGGNGNWHFLKYNHTNTVGRLVLDIPGFAKRHNLDYVHLFYVCPPLRMKSRLIVNICDILFTEFKNEFPASYYFSRKMMFSYAAKKSNILFTISNYSKDRIADCFKIKDKEIHILPNGFDHTFKYSINDENSAKMVFEKYGVRNFILLVSRIEPRKNHDLLLKAYRHLRLYEKDISMVFVGSRAIENGELYATIQTMPTEAKNRIHFFEDVPMDDLIDMYRSARLFVFPSKGEGFGYPPIEAASLSAPTICSNSTAMSDFQFFGIPQFSPFDIDDLEKQMVRYLNSERKDFFDIALKIRETLTWEKCANVFANVVVDDFLKQRLKNEN